MMILHHSLRSYSNKPYGNQDSLRRGRGRLVPAPKTTGSRLPGPGPNETGGKAHKDQSRICPRRRRPPARQLRAAGGPGPAVTVRGTGTVTGPEEEEEEEEEFIRRD